MPMLIIQNGMHGHGHGKGFGLPFLANATAQEREQFLAILKNRTLDKASKEAAIETLVATLDPAIQEAYKTWKQEKEAALAQKVRQIMRLLSAGCTKSKELMHFVLYDISTRDDFQP